MARDFLYVMKSLSIWERVNIGVMLCCVRGNRFSLLNFTIELVFLPIMPEVLGIDFSAVSRILFVNISTVCSIFIRLTSRWIVKVRNENSFQFASSVFQRWVVVYGLFLIFSIVIQIGKWLLPQRSKCVFHCKECISSTELKLRLIIMNIPTLV